MRRVLIALSVLAVAAVVAAPAASAKVRQGPKGAAFYDPPGNAKGRHGTLIWARRQTGPDAIAGRRSRLLLYRSTGPDGKANAVSGSLALPKGRAPKGGWPVITYAHGTTGSADACAPTRGYDANTLVSYAYPLLRRWLKAGYAVVRTDYEGLGTPGVHAYLGGPTEGYSVLDAVRAARRLEPRLSRRLVVAGHSQGGHAALFAASLAPSWTPELRLRGTVAFAPASHLGEQFPLATQFSTPGGGLGAIIALGVRAIDTADPSVDVAGLLTPEATAFYPQTETACHDALSRPESFGGLPLNQIFRSGADLGPLVAAIERGDPENLRIRTPVRVEQGDADGTVFKSFTDQLVDKYEAAGVKVTYKVYPGGSHGGVVTDGAGDASKWIRGRLRK
jgi:pimeloyl-ACP methyl ester carboxylesterase